MAPYFPDKLFANYDHHFWASQAGASQYRLLRFWDHQSPDIIVVHPLYVSESDNEEKEFLEKINLGIYEPKVFMAYEPGKYHVWGLLPTIIYIKKSLISAKENK